MKLTATQRRVLTVLAAGGTLRATDGPGWFTAKLHPVDEWEEVVRRSTMDALCNRGLIEAGEARPGRRGLPLTHYALTEAGREAAKG